MNDPGKKCYYCKWMYYNECRRNAPVGVAMTYNEGLPPVVEPRWPYVGGYEWCGQWESDGTLP